MITQSNGRLSYASVNLRDVRALTTFSPRVFPNSLVLAQSDGLRIGRIDDTQKLQIRTLTLDGDQPAAIAYSAANKAYGVVCLHEELDRKTGASSKTANLKILDGATFEGTWQGIVDL